ncbi:MAG: ribosome maturation factor RimP [Flammeovirgaceae bacterium]
MELNQKIRELAEAGLTNSAHFVVDVTISKYKPQKVTVFVDGDKGISIDDCADLSRYLGEKLDEENVMADAYTLEVSTPGIDHPLKLNRQYFANIGRQVKVLLKDKEIVKGRLVAANSAAISVETQNKDSKKKELTNIDIPFIEIEKTIVTVSFN